MTPATPPTSPPPQQLAPPREPYEAPQLEQVEIAADEAMLSLCKTDGGLGAFSVCGGGCSAPGS